MIKENVKIDDLVKLKKKMVTKEDLKGVTKKDDLQYLKELTKDIKNSCIPQEEDKKEKEDLFHSHLEKIEK